MNEFHDLSDEDKAKVVAGTVLVVIMLAAFLVFAQYFIIEDRLHISSAWESGMSLFFVTRMIIPGMYFIIFLPTAIVVGATTAYMRRRSSVLLSVLLISFGVGGYFLISALLLTLFDTFLSSSPVEMQILFMVLAFFIPAIIVAHALRVKKIRNYLKSL